MVAGLVSVGSLFGAVDLVHASCDEGECTRISEVAMGRGSGIWSKITCLDNPNGNPSGAYIKVGNLYAIGYRGQGHVKIEELPTPHWYEEDDNDEPITCYVPESSVFIYRSINRSN